MSLNSVSNNYFYPEISKKFPSLFLPIRPILTQPPPVKNQPRIPQIPQGQARPSLSLLSPAQLQNYNLTWENIRKGQVLVPGAKGNLVKDLQKKLTAAGFPVAQTGEFGPTTTEMLKKFQARFKIGQTGQVGSTTLKALEAAERVNKNGEKLAKTAIQVAKRRNTTGWCYAGAAEAILKGLGDALWGESAYMAASQLAKNKNFTEIKVSPSELTRLPKGAVVVWNKRPGGPHGHISIALGKGMEASDHIRPQFTSLRGRMDYRVFLPTHA